MRCTGGLFAVSFKFVVAVALERLTINVYIDTMLGKKWKPKYVSEKVQEARSSAPNPGEAPSPEQEQDAVDMTAPVSQSGINTVETVSQKPPLAYQAWRSWRL